MDRGLGRGERGINLEGERWADKDRRGHKTTQGLRQGQESDQGPSQVVHGYRYSSLTKRNMERFENV